MQNFRALFLLALTGSLNFGLAEGINDPAREATTQTQQTLTNPQLRREAIRGNPAAERANAQVESLAGSPQNAQKIYELAAEVFGNLSAEAAGDPDKMMDMLTKAAKNPEAFAAKFTPAQRKQLQELANSAKLP